MRDHEIAWGNHIELERVNRRLAAIESKLGLTPPEPPPTEYDVGPPSKYADKPAPPPVEPLEHGLAEKLEADGHHARQCTCGEIFTGKTSREAARELRHHVEDPGEKLTAEEFEGRTT